MVKHMLAARVEDKEAQAKLIEMFREVPTYMDFVYDMQAGYDFYGKPNSYDIGFVFSCDTEEDLWNYVNHPGHAALRDYLRSVRQQGAMATITYDPKPKEATYEHGVRHTLFARVDDPEARDKLVEMIKAMPDQMDFVHDMVCGYDFMKAGNSYDIGFTCTCPSREDFQRYIDHPAHIELRDYLREVRREGAMFTMEF